MSPENRWGHIAELGIGAAWVYCLYYLATSALIVSSRKNTDLITRDSLEGRRMYPSELQFAKAVAKIPHLEVWHEPDAIRLTEEDIGDPKKLRGQAETVPDFLVIDSRNPKDPGVYIEVTDGDTDTQRKRRQLAVMRAAGEDGRYVQIDRRGLRKLSRAKKNVARVLEFITGGLIAG